MRLAPAPKWMGAYCERAASDLGYAVLCPRELPTLIHIGPCRGPVPEEELWGRYCVIYTIDVLFEGPPGYRGPFGYKRRGVPAGSRMGHLALWSITADQRTYEGGLFACPGGGRTTESGRLAGHSGSWWACPTSGSDLNSGHVAFQWRDGDVIHGVSVHGTTDADKDIVRAVVDRLNLVGPTT